MGTKIGTFTPSNATIETEPNLFANKLSQTLKAENITASGVVRQNETPYSDEHFALVRAAANVGLPPGEQKKFADANADGKLEWKKGSDPTPKTDRTVRPEDYKGLVGLTKSYTLSANQVADLKRRVADYKARGGKLFSNREVLPNLAESVAVKTGVSGQRVGGATSIEGVLDLGKTPPTRFSVLLNNDDKPITNERILSQFIEDRYKGGNLWGENFKEIAQMSDGQGIKPTNINNKGNAGNKIAVYFDISVADQKKIHENYKAVQEKVNEIEKIANSTRDNMALNQFLKGVGEGAWETLKQNWEMLTNPIETIKSILDAVKTLASLSKEDLINLVEQLKQGGKDYIYNKDVSEVAHDAGKVVGTIAVEVILGKAVGLALKGLKSIKAVDSFLTKADDLAKLTKTKIAATFSDEAATAAKQRIASSMRNPKFYSGFAGGDLIGDFAVLAGNKMKNGAISFKEFVDLAVAEYGSNIKGKIEELAEGYRQAMQRLGFGNKIIEIEIEKTSKIAKSQFARESNGARQKLLDAIKQAENEGKVAELPSADRKWLMQDARYKELAFDPDKKQFKVKEAQAIIEAERQGVIKSPVKRGIFDDGSTRGADYIDVDGIEWDMKDSSGGSSVILEALGKGENVVVDARGMNQSDFEKLKSQIEAKRPKNGNEVRYIR